MTHITQLLIGTSPFAVGDAHRDGKDLRQACVVGGHHLLLGLPLGHQDELLDVFHGTKRFSPQLKLACNL